MSLEMKYFVLKPSGKDVHAQASRNALRAYASTLYRCDETEFGNDLMEWVEVEQHRAELVEGEK